MYIDIWCTYCTLLFDTVSTIIEALVIVMHQFLYPFIVEWCRLWCKASGNSFFDLRHNFEKKWPWNLRTMQGKWRNGESSVLPNLLFNCTHQIFIHHRQSATPWIITHIFTPSLNCRTHLCTIELLMACSPYTSESWRISAGVLFFAFKKWITDRISHAAGFSIFLNIINTQHDAWTLFKCLQILSVPCQRISKLGMHVHHRDHSAAEAIFANGTYFLDKPCIINCFRSYRILKLPMKFL